MAWREMTHSRSAKAFERNLETATWSESVDETGARVVEVDGKQWRQRDDGTWFTTRLHLFPDDV